MGARVRLNRAAIDRLGRHPAVQRGTLNVAKDVQREVRRRTAGSATLNPFGRMTVAKNTATGAAVGTDWGPAVPVEFGTFATPAHRILHGAAERVAGKVTPR